MTPVAEQIDGFRCEACGTEGFIDDVNPVPVYECGRCGTVFNGEDGNRCPDCHVFASKVGDGACPDCDSGPVEPVSLWAVETPAEGWVFGDTPQTVEDEARDVAARNTPEAKAAAAKRREETLTKVYADLDERRRIFRETLPDIRTVLRAVHASPDEIERFDSEFVWDSTTQQVSRETFINMCRLVAPGVPDQEPLPHDPWIDTLEDGSVLQRISLESEHKANAYVVALPTIIAALDTVDASPHEREHLGSVHAKDSTISSMETSTFLALCRTAAASEPTVTSAEK